MRSCYENDTSAIHRNLSYYGRWGQRHLRRRPGSTTARASRPVCSTSTMRTTATCRRGVKTKMNLLSPYVKATFGPVYVEGEATYWFGTYKEMSEPYRRWTYGCRPPGLGAYVKGEGQLRSGLCRVAVRLCLRQRSHRRHEENDESERRRHQLRARLHPHERWVQHPESRQ